MPSLQTDTWPAVLEHIKTTVGEQRFGLWFRSIKPLEINGDVIKLGVPNLFVQDWLENNFKGVLRQALAREMGDAPTVHFAIEPELFRASRKQELEAGAAIVEAAAPREKKSVDVATSMRPDFTLDNFVVGQCNKLLHACAMEILNSSSNHLHPLFVHSLSGLGKTHLLQAIWHEIQQRDDGRKVVYLSAETFTNQFVYAIRNRRLDPFRHRYRTADILLMDDVQFLNNKRGIQEELLHTYDALDSRNGQLVLASDVHPKMLMQMRRNLVNRFASGMIVHIGQPDFSTRVAILKAKLKQQRRRVPEEVLRYVARGFEGNVRELSGAATTVLAYASLSGEKIDIALARTALIRLGRVPTPANSGMGSVETVIAKHYGLKPARLRARKQTRATRLPRQACMYLARQCTPLSCREIAQHFGSSNHSLVVHACKRIESARRDDKHLDELIAAMEAEIKKA